MLFNSYSYEILYEQFHWIYLEGDIKLLLVTVNNRLKFEIEIVHDLSCHPIKPSCHHHVAMASNARCTLTAMTMDLIQRHYDHLFGQWMLRLQHINSTDFNHTFDDVSMKKLSWQSKGLKSRNLCGITKNVNTLKKASKTQHTVTTKTRPTKS